ncbi:MAG: hypothetical protein KDJ75_07185 [Alphaproteobacteria bacterium]|nr:hypothetical protein [Alphaproteobacteria bacterium]
MFNFYRLRRSSLRESTANEAIQRHEEKFWIAAPPLAARNDMMLVWRRLYHPLT